MPSRSATPTLTFHESTGLSIPTPSMFNAASGGAHVSSEVAGKNVSESLEGAHETGNDVELEPSRQKIMDDVHELFCSRPTIEIFQRSWSKDAVFEDPLSKCFGYNEYAPQWFGMPKVFPQSRTLKSRVLSSTHTPNRLVYSQSQEYTVRGLGIKKIMDSVVVIELDDSDKIVKLEDKWNGNPHPEQWGAHYLRRANAKTLPWFVTVPKLRGDHDHEE